MTSKSRTGVLFLVMVAQISGPAASLIQRDVRNNDLGHAVHNHDAIGASDLKEIRDFVKHGIHDHSHIRNRDRKFYEDEINYFKSLLGSYGTETEHKAGKGKRSGENKKQFPKTYNNEESAKTLARIKRQTGKPNFPHFVMPRSASYSTGYVNLQPNGPFLHHVAVNVPNFPHQPPPMQPFLAPNPVAAYPQSLPYLDSNIINNPGQASRATYQRSVLPNSREVNLQLLKSENEGGDAERAPRMFVSARNTPATFGRADLASNLLGERFQTIDSGSPFVGGLRQNSPILDSIGQNFDRSRIQMLEQQVRMRDERLRSLEQELMRNCNRRPEIFSGGRQNLANNFDGFGSFGGRQNVPEPMRGLQDFQQPLRPMFQGRSKSQEHEDEFARPQSAHIDEGTEHDQIQRAKDFDFNKEPVSYTEDEGYDGQILKPRPPVSNAADSKKAGSSQNSDVLLKEQKNLNGAAENAFQPKAASKDNEAPVSNEFVNESGQFVDGQWLPPANQQPRNRNNEGIPFCVPAPAQASAPAPAPAPAPRQRNNEEQEIPANVQDLDKDQQKLVLETLQQAVEPLMQSIDAIKENGLDLEEPAKVRPIPKLKDILESRAPLPLPRMPAFRSGGSSAEVFEEKPLLAQGRAPPSVLFEKETPRILSNLRGMGDDQARPLKNALEKMRTNRKEILQDLAGNIKPLERPGLLQGLKRPPILEEILSPAVVAPSAALVDNEEGSELPVQKESAPGAETTRKIVAQQPNLMEVSEEKVGKAIKSNQPLLTKSSFDEAPAEENSEVITSSKKANDDLLTKDEEPETPAVEVQDKGLLNSSPRMKASEADATDYAPSETMPRSKAHSKSGKELGIMGLDSLRESTPAGKKDKSLHTANESQTMSPRENENNSGENLVDMEMEEAAPMARNNEGTATKEPAEPSVCQKIIKEIVADEMESHAKEDANPAMFINKNFTSELMKRVNIEIAKYRQDHATDGLDFTGTCDDADMKLEIVSQVLLMLNQWIQEVPATADAGPNSLTAGQINEIKHLLDS